MLAGLTVGAYLVPQVMAYGELAGLPPVAGLWAILLPLLVYSALGSSRLLSAGPESSTAVMTAAAVGTLAHGDAARYAALAAMLGLLVGAVFLVAFVLRLGFVADLLSRPVLVGYLTGIALIMISSQLTKTTGVPVSGDTFADQTWSFLRHLDSVEGAAIAVAAPVLVFLFVVRWRFPKVPGPLVAVLASSAVVAVFSLEAHGVTVVGSVPVGLPEPRVPDVAWGDLGSLLAPAVAIAVVGFTDSVLTARAFAARHGEDIDTSRELLALGASNVGAGALQGFPVSSSASRTAIADTVGARSQLASLTALALVVVVLLFASSVLESFPRAALGAIVVYAAVGLIDVPEVRRLVRFRYTEALLALAAAVGVLVTDILVGVVIAVVLSAIDTIHRIARPHDAVLGRVPGVAGLHDVDDYPSAQTVPGLLVYRYDAPLFFANAEDFKIRALASLDAEERRQSVEWFLLNAEANVGIDITAADALESLRAMLAERGVVFAMARVKQDLLEELDAAGLVDRIGRDHMFPTLPTALEAFERRRG